MLQTHNHGSPLHGALPYYWAAIEISGTPSSFLTLVLLHHPLLKAG
jgi:hypothetical protein